jgi:hypothetical protein
MSSFAVPKNGIFFPLFGLTNPVHRFGVHTVYAVSHELILSDYPISIHLYGRAIVPPKMLKGSTRKLYLSVLFSLECPFKERPEQRIGYELTITIKKTPPPYYLGWYCCK